MIILRLHSLGVKGIVIVEPILNLAICVHKLTFPILLVLLPHTDIIISRGINVATIAMFLLSLELAFVEMTVLSQMTSDTFPLVLRIKLTDISCVFNFKFPVMQLRVQIDWVIFLHLEQVYSSKLFPFSHEGLMAVILLLSNIRFRF